MLTRFLGETHEISVFTTLTPLTGTPENVVLFASVRGEIELSYERRGRGYHLKRCQHVDARDAQKFYEQLLVQLGYEVPRVKLREVFKGRLRVRRSEHLVAGKRRTEFTLNCRVGDLYSGVSSRGLVPTTISVSFGPKRATELCRALAEPLGWELEE